jgi:hypothetical protein
VCSIVDPVVEVKTFAAGFIYARPLQRGIAAQLLFKKSERCLIDILRNATEQIAHAQAASLLPSRYADTPTPMKHPARIDPAINMNNDIVVPYSCVAI